jgi:phospholipid N-methyltransferase
LIRDRVLFLSKFIQHPLQIGSVTPSSRYLVNRMAKSVNWSAIESLVELGAGTGVFTRKINQLKSKSCKALIIEKDPDLRNHLSRLYPDLHFGVSAGNFHWMLQNLNIHQVDCIVSGLPFANFAAELQEKILDEITTCLKPDGIFVMFQYSWQMKSKLEQRFHNVSLSVVPLNFPPAIVYECQGIKNSSQCRKQA